MKTKMCNFLPFCPNGKDCNYAHSESELIKNPFYKTRMCTTPNCIRSKCGYAHSHSELKTESRENPFFKAVLCKNLSACAFGDQCWYAHSIEEQQKAKRKINEKIDSREDHDEHKLDDSGKTISV